MKVFKFGGGVLHSASAIKKIPEITKRYPDEPLVIVVSALGKTTNALEELVDASSRKDDQAGTILGRIRAYHEEIITGLHGNDKPAGLKEVDLLWAELENLAMHHLAISYNCLYDELICYGELVSSRIVSSMFSSLGISHKWIDIRQILRTDDNFRDASVDWKASQANASAVLAPLLEPGGQVQKIVVTQGFIGRDHQGRSTSLGREGSDYTAAILASLLDASEVITWKDVPGILNADPKHFRQTVKLDQITYAEATELAYYGAKVIHPKTVKPLQNKGIPLQVRSFDEPDMPGTIICAGAESDYSIPSFIFKFDQVLISVSTRDFSFINEKVFNDVFSLLTRYSMHVNIVQNSALKLSLCIDHHPGVQDLIRQLQADYVVRYNQGLELITIRHYNRTATDLVIGNREVILEQQNRTVVQYVVR